MKGDPDHLEKVGRIAVPISTCLQNLFIPFNSSFHFLLAICPDETILHEMNRQVSEAINHGLVPRLQNKAPVKPTDTFHHRFIFFCIR
jgi:hypothetical protein